MTVYGTYRRPVGRGKHVPAALLIAGSGPTDRDGNSPAIPGEANTLKTLADWLSAEGFASLRYDKLGSGRTGLGTYGTRPRSIGLGVFEQEAAGALTYLAARPGIDTDRLTVLGHSEGALLALLLATGRAGATPPIHSLGLIEPISGRYLDIIGQQVRAQLASPQVNVARAARLRRVLRSTIVSLRRSGTVPGGLPAELASLFNPSAIRFLAEADRIDPAALAAHLSAHLPVIVSCSDADIQVSCTDVQHLIAGLRRARTDNTVVRLAGVNHVLKEDTSRTAARYGAQLRFSRQLRRALHGFLTAQR